MGRRRPHRHRQHTLPSDQAQQAMQQDYPSALKWRLRLLAKGGRAIPQRCIVCAKRGMFSMVWTPAEVLSPLPDTTAQPATYWVCATHHETLSDEELVKLLAQRGRNA